VSGNSGVEEEFLWTCTLTGADKVYDWSPEDPIVSKDDEETDSEVKPGHKLLIKSAILMPGAKEGEVTVVQIESEGYNKQKVVVPIVAMRAGTDYQTYVDLLVPGQAKISLLQGEGPIHLVGSHCVDSFGYRDTGAEDDAEDEMEAEEEVGEKEAEELVKDAAKKTPTKESVEEAGDSKKRKASEEQASSQEKKAKASPAAKASPLAKALPAAKASPLAKASPAAKASPGRAAKASQ